MLKPGDLRVFLLLSVDGGHWTVLILDHGIQALSPGKIYTGLTEDGLHLFYEGELELFPDR